MKHLKHLSIALTAFALAAPAAFADWYRAAEIATTGGAKEISANFQNVRAIQVQWLDGDVDLHSITVRSVGSKEEFAIGRQLSHGETLDFQLDGRSITGFRVIDRGNGHYCINVSSDNTQYYEHHHHHLDSHHHPRPDATPDVRKDGPRQPAPPAAGQPVAPKKPDEVKPRANKTAPKASSKPAPAKAPAKAPARRAPAKGR